MFFAVGVLYGVRHVVATIFYAFGLVVVILAGDK